MSNGNYSFFDSQTKNKSKDAKTLKNLLHKSLKCFMFDDLTKFLIYGLLFIFFTKLNTGYSLNI